MNGKEADGSEENQHNADDDAGNGAWGKTAAFVLVILGL